jgi:GNAT superfamily N-acetyltransferase
MSWHVRPIGQGDAHTLEEMLYQAIHVPPGEDAPPRDVIKLPELARYIQGWGRDGDLGLLAIEDESGRPIGAAWLRLLRGDERGYGHVDDATPELSIAIVPEQRGHGIGTRLLGALIARARGRYTAISLSAGATNPAIRLYQRFGFAVVRAEGASLVMRLDL